MQLKHEADLHQLRSKRQQVTVSLEEEKLRLQSFYKVEFKVPQHLLGLVIGKQGKNILAASKLDGVER